MTPAERFKRCMHLEPVDHVVDMEFGYWDEVHTLWESDGLPAGLDTHEKMELYFGLERRYRPPVNFLIEPEFGVEEVDIRNGYRYYYDADRVLCRVPTNGLTTMPEHVEYPLKGRREWEQIFKPRYDPDLPGRYPADLSDHIDRHIALGYNPWLYVGSLFGRFRNFTGFAEICYLIHDDPTLVDEMIQCQTDLVCAILERTGDSIKGRVHIAHFWEDIAFNTGPMISPAFFREHLTPRYTQITQVLKGLGIDIVIVDCDGWIGPLVEGWLEGGVNVMFPLERASGSDPRVLREKYGMDVRLLGGVDKKKIALGGDEIIRELESLAPLVEEGGFIPHCDHLCPADVTLEKYRHYLKYKRDIFGMPLKEERVRRYPNDPGI